MKPAYDLVAPLAQSTRGTSAGYRTDIDGIRAIAVLSVLAFHLNHELLPGGFAGVDVFFVISGFLITGIIKRELEEGSFTLLGFYERRVRRIFPALFFTLVATAIELREDELTWSRWPTCAADR